jgi:two-component system, OmpR family, KDP operon response regulator KdpE
MTDASIQRRDTTEPSKILIVDDEVQIIRVLSMACTARGYRVKSAEDGESALNVLKSWSADLVITDLSMPNMDGVRLCRAIRKQSNVPILVLSVRNHEKIKVEALDAGADDYVTKPFQIDELLARIRAALRRFKNTTAADKTAEVVIGDFRIDPGSRQVFVFISLPKSLICCTPCHSLRIGLSLAAHSWLRYGVAITLISLNLCGF